MVKGIKWLGHASLCVEREGRKIYIDPWKLESFVPADIVLVTHSHYDHCSPEDIEKLLKSDTIVAGPGDALEKIQAGNKKVLLPGESFDEGWITVEGVASYNRDKEFHPKGNNWLGFLLRFKGETIYIAGDTDFVPEMEQIKADIAILPVGGTYTMDAAQAAAAANAIKPEIAIPIHFGDIVGSEKDARLFTSLVKDVRVEILEPSS